jgi:hypothetical protein
MGCWGVGIYQNDISDDVCIEYKQLLQQGKSDADAYNTMIAGNEDLLKDPDDAVDFWIALADTQWKLGRLCDEAKSKALELMSMEKTEEKYSHLGKGALRRRNEVLTKLREQLNSPQPQRKKIPIVHPYVCDWKDGDVYALHMKSDSAARNGLAGQYLLIQKIYALKSEYFPYSTLPIVRIKITKTGKCPLDEAEFNQLEYVQIRARAYSDRFFPYNAKLSAEEERAEIDALKIVTDEAGFLPEYRAELFIKSDRQVSRYFQYLGSFPNAIPPEIEFVPRGGLLGLQGYPLNVLEECIIRNYLNMNLGGFDIYKHRRVSK